MKSSTQRSMWNRFSAPRKSLAACVALVCIAGSAAAQAPDLQAIWNDPTFQRQFLAGYGVNAEVEPRISPEEVEVLEKVRPLMADNLPKAEEVLRKQMKGHDSATFDYTLGSIQFQQDRFAEALANYRKAVTKFPSFRRAWRNIGLINVREGNHDAAIQAFTRMIELGGADAYSYGLLGFSHSAKLDYQPAEAAYRNALLLQPDNVEWRLGLTRCVFKQEKFEDAGALLDVLIARHPDKGDFWLLQAHAFLGRKLPLKAAENLEALDQLGKSTVDSLHTLGDIYVSENLMDLAARAYGKAIGIDSNQPLARPLRAAEVLAARGGLPQAREIAAQIHRAFDARLQDDERRKLLKLEARLSMADGVSNTETVAVLEEIVRLDPLDGEALMLLGQHHGRLNEPDRAIFYYERAASLEAFEAGASIRHAQTLVGLGRYAEALPLLRRAQDVKPREDIARYIDQVERIAKARR